MTQNLPGRLSRVLFVRIFPIKRQYVGSPEVLGYVLDLNKRFDDAACFFSDEPKLPRERQGQVRAFAQCLGPEHRPGACIECPSEDGVKMSITRGTHTDFHSSPSKTACAYLELPLLSVPRSNSLVRKWVGRFATAEVGPSKQTHRTCDKSMTRGSKAITCRAALGVASRPAASESVGRKASLRPSCSAEFGSR